MPDTKISQFPGLVGQEVTIRGWVVHRRSSGKIAFLIIRDGGDVCQAVIEKEKIGEESYAEIKKIPHESSICLTGELVREERAAGGYELHVNAVSVIHHEKTIVFLADRNVLRKF